MLPYILGGAAALALLGSTAVRRKKHHRSGDPRTAATQRIRIVDSRHAKTLRMARVNPEEQKGTCDECGKRFRIDSYGIANHTTKSGKVDHDADADHVPFSQALNNPRVSKTHIEYVIQGNYGYGWDDENTELTWPDARRSLREYRANGGGSYRCVKRRVKNDATNPKRRRKGKKAKWSSPGTAASRLAWWRWHHNPKKYRKVTVRRKVKGKWKTVTTITKTVRRVKTNPRRRR